MRNLSVLRDTRPVLVTRMLLVLGLVAANVAIGLLWQRLPLKLLLAAAGGTGLVLLGLRDMPAALTLIVMAAGIVSFSVGTGTMSRLNVAMLLVALFSGVWILRMLVTRRLGLAPTPLNRPLLAFLLAGAASLVYGLAIAGQPGGCASQG